MDDDAELDRRIRGLVTRRYSREYIAERLGISVAEVAERIARSWGRSTGKLTGKSQQVDPTPEEIAERAAIERQSWSESEHRRRAGLPERMAYEIPTGIKIASID